jgi:hypothetical protein
MYLALLTSITKIYYNTDNRHQKGLEYIITTSVCPGLLHRSIFQFSMVTSDLSRFPTCRPTRTLKNSPVFQRSHVGEKIHCKCTHNKYM